MKIRISINSLDEYIPYLALFLYITINFLGTTFYSAYIPNMITTGIMILSVGLLIFKEFISARFTGKTLFVYLLSFFLAILTVISSEGLSPYFYTLFVIFLLRDIDFKKIVGFVLPLITFLLIFTIVSSKFGIIWDYIEITSTRVRHYLGFRYALFPSTMMLHLVALTVYLKGSSISYRRLMLLLISTTWIYMQTNSRLTFISSLILLLLSLLVKWFPNFLSRIRGLLFFLIPSYLYSFVMSYFIVMRYPYFDSFILNLNRFLGDRIYLAYKSVSIYGFSWIGERIAWVGNGLDSLGNRNTTSSYLYVDNMYIQVLQRYGYVFLIIFIVLLTVLLASLYRKKQYLLMTIMILLAFHATIDDLIFSLHYNTFLLLLWTPFSDKNTFLEGD